MIEVRNLTVEFPGAGAWHAAVRDLSLGIAAGETLGLVGESGSGKSVAALSLLRLLPPQARVRGRASLNGQDLFACSQEEIRQVRGARIAMIFQEPMTALNPVMRVGDQVAEAVLAHAQSSVVGRQPSAVRNEATQRAVEALRDVGIPEPEQRARDYPHQLSGGMRQRVMIAMAIVNRPQLLIADEPTTALDVTVQAQILDLLKELRHKFGLAMLFISHDLGVVSSIADRVAVLYAGCLVESASAPEIFTRPLHPYTRGLLNAVPTLRTDRSRPLASIEGTVPPVTAPPPGCPFEPRCPIRVSQCAAALPPLEEVAPGHLVRCPVALHR
ncbi:MAG TPA: ABC transporter ATP-binding protein [Terriglobales bacterium]|nr:ABC transporter ATP-binding protein [Terriglobales bacterium]